MTPRLPYTFAEATEIVNAQKAAQRGAEDFIKAATRDFAEAERRYREALAKEIIRQHADGVAWTVCQDLARGDDTVARLRYERDVAEGVRDAAAQAAFRHGSDRRDLSRLIEWSMRRELAEHGGWADEADARETVRSGT